MTARTTATPIRRWWWAPIAMLGLLAALVPAAPADAQTSGTADVTIVAPEAGALPAVAAPGDTVQVTFTTNRRAWHYQVRVRPVGDDGDGIPAAGSDATGTTVIGQQTVTVQVPVDAAPGDHDLIVDLVAPARDPQRVVDRDVVPSAVQAIPSVLPTTGFEDRAGDGWTTHEEELAFLEQLDELSPRIRISELGQSVEGRPIQVVRVGFPAAPADDADIAAGRNILWISTQHGNEPAPREGGLEVIRDLAFTADDDLLGQLNDTTVLLIPTANPDGRVANTRVNADGVDTNRDHFEFNTTEARAMQAAERTFSPDITIDAHERPGGSVPDMELLWPRNLNVDTEVLELSQEMVEDQLFPDLEDAGWTTGIYGTPGGAGGKDERIKRNAIGLRHGMGLLTETGGQNPPLERVEQQRITFYGVLEFHRDNRDRIAEVVEGAPDRRASDGAAREPFFLDGADNFPPEPEDILDPAPCGYLLHEGQVASIERTIELHDIELESVSEFGRFATMAQPMMTVIPLLFDERADFNLVEGIALDDCSDPGSIEPPPPPPEPTEPAQWSTDFSDTEPGETPEGWSELWRSSDWVVQDDPRLLRHTVGDAGGRRALVWDEVGDDGLVVGDVEIAALVRTQDTGATMLQFGVHYGGDAGSEDAYYVDLRRAGQLRVNTYNAGTYSGQGSSSLSFTPQDGTWYHIVLQREDTALRAKIWPDGQDEPDGWTVTGSSTAFDQGYVGLSHFTAETVNDFAFIGVGTGGDPAPRADD